MSQISAYLSADLCHYSNAHIEAMQYAYLVRVIRMQIGSR
jgi:hypothetical protein